MIDILDLEWWQVVLAIVVAILGAARLTRLVVFDDFPPVAALRRWYRSQANEDWETLVECHWCFGPWAFGAAVISFLLTLVYPWAAWIWWIWWGTLAGGYLVSQYVHFDDGSKGS